MKIPKIEKMDVNTSIKDLASQYVPEWSYDENDPDIGVTLCKVLGRMFDNTIREFNRVPYNYYVQFLNLLGTKLAPSASSRGMITVTPTEGSNGTYVKKGAFLYASANNKEGRVFFETTDAMYAVDSRLQSIYFTDGESDSIIKIYDQESDGYLKPFRLFYNDPSQNIQKHEIYLCDDDLLVTKNRTNIEIVFDDRRSKNNENFLKDFFSDKKQVTWQYFKDQTWLNVEQVSKTEKGIELKFSNNSDIYECMGKSSRFLKCVVDKIPSKGIYLTDISMASKGENIAPDGLLHDMSELSQGDFFPFGDEYTAYTDFYIASNEAFTKKGAQIDIDVEIQFLNVKVENDGDKSKIKYRNIMHKSDFESPEPTSTRITKVSWEYWNGLGWARLYDDDTNEDFFAVKDEKVNVKTLSFECPKDMSRINVGPYNSCFIRARITKVRNPFNIYGNFVTPYVHSMKIKYNYLDNQFISCNEVFVNSDLTYKHIFLDQIKQQDILKRTLSKYPTIYLRFDKILSSGPIRMLFDMEESTRKVYPPVQWEYYALNEKGELRWEYIRVSDATSNFKHSAIVSLMGKKNFVETELFGKKGFYVRLFNSDLEYRKRKDESNYPKVNGFYLNTVPVIQKESQRAEYFAVDKIDENKVCKLSNNNLVEARVWVNELGSLSTLEEEYFIENVDNDKIKVKMNEAGQPTELWVEWKEIHSIKAAGFDERAFEVDYSKGCILFGNGRYGKIPTYQETKSIMVEYSISHGSYGNVEANQIKGFYDAVPYISTVQNFKSMTGGIDQETVEEASKRVATNIAGMNRIISIDDFEYAVCMHNRSIYKIKCIPHVNMEGNEVPGMLSVAILPKEILGGYEKFSLIKEDVEQFIRERAPVTMLASGNLNVFEVIYVEIEVDLELVVDDYNYCHEVQEKITSKLSAFLHPITGNFDGHGWEIGRIATKEQIYNCIKSVNNIKWIKKVVLFTKIVTSRGKKNVDFATLKGKSFIVPVFGGTEINMSVEPESERNARR